MNMLTREEILIFEKRFRVLKSLIEKETKHEPFYYRMDTIAEGYILGQIGNATFTITPHTQWETLSPYIKQSIKTTMNSKMCIKCKREEFILILQCSDCMTMMCQQCHFQHKDVNHRLCVLCGTVRGSKGELTTNEREPAIGCEKEHITNEREPASCNSKHRKRGMRKRRRGRR